jgi:hypothetical protein
MKETNRKEEQAEERSGGGRWRERERERGRGKIRANQGNQGISETMQR